MESDMSDPSLIARGVIHIPINITNAYMVETDYGWVLIDCGTAGYARNIIRVANAFFGSDARPLAILLTHGHFDHAGSARELAEHWRVPLYAHRLELPFLTGKSKYPPQDPTVGGFMANMVRFVPNRSYDFGHRVQEFPGGAEPPSMPRWELHHTPGHTPGHVSFFRRDDRVLIAGDAFITVDQSSMTALLTKRQEVCPPPTYYTPDWVQAEQSVKKLAALDPDVLATGHGTPMHGAAALAELKALADHFPVPSYGRYVNEPAIANEEGVIHLPPPVPDPVKRAGAAIGGAAVVGITAALAGRRRKRAA
jgi:glyoxylase-like metal-dependent hydrolase (beta-lactamase superfamily II)